MISVTLLIAFAFQRDNLRGQSEKELQITTSSIKIESSLFVDDVPLVDEAIMEYMEEENERTAHDVYGLYGGHSRVVNNGLPVHYTYEVTGLPANISVTAASLEVSEEADYSNSKEYTVDHKIGSVDVYHLKVDTEYYYRLKLTLSNNSIAGTVGTFKTASSPRFLKIEGITNVRDIGGWQTVDGKTVKQGLLYRGTELDGAVESKYCLTPQGKSIMLETLGIRYDMDFRAPAENKNKTNALGDGIPHKYYVVPSYDNFFNQENNAIMKSIFSDLANKNNYPMYAHCTYGRDRTGMICYLLEGLLGVSEEDAYKDYELSAFTDSFISEEDFNIFKTRLDSFSGSTLKDKVEGYLLSIGVTATEIQNIRTIFLG